MDKKVKRIMIGLFLILLILLIVVLIILQNQKVDSKAVKRDLSYINNNEWNDEIHPNGMPKLVSLYRGKLTAQNMGKSMYYFATDVLPTYYDELKDAKEQKILSFYNTNAKLIAKETGIENEQDFETLIENIRKLNAEHLVLESFRIDKDKIEPSSKSTEAILYITYQGNDEIGFNLKIYSALRNEISSLVYSVMK